jgi:hypothetical protein
MYGLISKAAQLAVNHIPYESFTFMAGTRSYHSSHLTQAHADGLCTALTAVAQHSELSLQLCLMLSSM